MSADRPHTIQIFGERCSGTNYLESLVRANLPAARLTWDFGHKHFFPRRRPRPTADHLFVFLYRNPFEWLRSMYRNPWHAAPSLQGLTFSAFLRQEWVCVWNEDAGVRPGQARYGQEILRERDPDTGERFANLMRLRATKIRVWEALRTRVEHALLINYEALAAAPEPSLAALADRLGREIPQPFRTVTGYKGLKWYQGWRTRLFRQGAPGFSRADRDFVLAELDEAAERAIGYDVPALARDIDAV